MKNKWFIILSLLIAPILLAAGCKKWTETDEGAYRLVTNKGGQTLGYSPASGVKLIFRSGYAFKDLNRNEKLDRFEDWRLSADERAVDLAGRLTMEQMAGLMLYSPHQSVPARRSRFGSSTYGGKPFEESGATASDLSDQQKKFLTEDNLRHVLITRVESPEVAATWNNNVQALCESIGLGIPANNSSDPRHRSDAEAEYQVGSAGQISMWPGSLGMAATFDPDVVRQFGEIASAEYRALGITTALSPQIDLATEPRWNRVSGTFGESPLLSADMARAYTDGFQTSAGDKEIDGGWGYTSVNAMVKHWPGGGTGEGGRDAHFSYGKYGIFPGNNLAEHLVPFTEGAFKLSGATGKAAAVMPYYTISMGVDTVNNENVGNSYSEYLINQLLRGKYGFEGVACTDWGVTHDAVAVDGFGTTPWGVENLGVAERHYKAILAGMDQFGGNSDVKPLLEAYEMGAKEHGEAFMRQRFEQSAVRLLRNIFRVGLFENPYLNVEETRKLVGNEKFMEAGYQAQLRSVVMLKNRNNSLPRQNAEKVYVPKVYRAASRGFFGNSSPAVTDYPISMELVKKYYTVTDNPGEADFALVVINSPATGQGYDAADAKRGGSGYLPISLQYKKYTASYARDNSLAGGDPLESFTNRSYKGKSVAASNLAELEAVLATRKAMAGKPLIVVVRTSRPFVCSEFESETDAMLLTFEIQDQAILDIVSGKAEPTGLLPFQMPADMLTVESQNEDVPFDMQCHTDANGNTYDFGFGLNWQGRITDARTERYANGRK